MANKPTFRSLLRGRVNPTDPAEEAKRARDRVRLPNETLAAYVERLSPGFTVVREDVLNATIDFARTHDNWRGYYEGKVELHPDHAMLTPDVIEFIVHPGYAKFHVYTPPVKPAPKLAGRTHVVRYISGPRHGIEVVSGLQNRDRISIFGQDNAYLRTLYDPHNGEDCRVYFVYDGVQANHVPEVIREFEEGQEPVDFHSNDVVTDLAAPPPPATFNPDADSGIVFIGGPLHATPVPNRITLRRRYLHPNEDGSGATIYQPVYSQGAAYYVDSRLEGAEATMAVNRYLALRAPPPPAPSSAEVRRLLQSEELSMAQQLVRQWHDRQGRTMPRFIGGGRTGEEVHPDMRRQDFIRLVDQQNIAAARTLETIDGRRTEDLTFQTITYNRCRIGSYTYYVVEGMSTSEATIELARYVAQEQLSVRSRDRV